MLKNCSLKFPARKVGKYCSSQLLPIACSAAVVDQIYTLFIPTALTALKPLNKFKYSGFFTLVVNYLIIYNKSPSSGKSRVIQRQH